MLTLYPDDKKFARKISVSSNSLASEWKQPLYGGSVLEPTKINNTKSVIANPLREEIKEIRK